MNNKVNILGVAVDNVTIEQAQLRIWDMLLENRCHAVFTPNSEIIMAAYKDKGFSKVLNTADLLLADGIGVVHASKIVGSPLKERVAGFDVACKLIEQLSDRGHSIYLFGSKPGVSEIAKANLEKGYPGIKVVGACDGYFDSQREKDIIADINEKSPDILLVCLGSPKQENWIYKNRQILNCRVALGVGGTIDILAGEAKRAPEFFVRLGLEWLYRIVKFKRLGRAVELPKFALAVIINKYFKK